MLCYNYDDITYEYLSSAECVLDPLETEQQGIDVWMLPANATFTEPPAVQKGFVRVWQKVKWVQVEDHRGTKYWPKDSKWDDEPIEMKDLGPLPEGSTTTQPEKTLEEAKALKIAQVDTETSSAILAGFDYKIEGIKYHFSYDSFDQQNFSDTANMCQLALSGTKGLPTSVTWNSYLADGALVQHTFDAQSFLTLYTTGAMQHKATQMAIGGQRKAAVQAATTIEEVETI